MVPDLDTVRGNATLRQCISIFSSNQGSKENQNNDTISLYVYSKAGWNGAHEMEEPCRYSLAEEQCFMGSKQCGGKAQ